LNAIVGIESEPETQRAVALDGRDGLKAKAAFAQIGDKSAVIRADADIGELIEPLARGFSAVGFHHVVEAMQVQSGFQAAWFY